MYLFEVGDFDKNPLKEINGLCVRVYLNANGDNFSRLNSDQMTHFR